jgi:hypothetical protein
VLPERRDRLHSSAQAANSIAAFVCGLGWLRITCYDGSSWQPEERKRSSIIFARSQHCRWMSRARTVGWQNVFDDGPNKQDCGLELLVRNELSLMSDEESRPSNCMVLP